MKRADLLRLSLAAAAAATLAAGCGASDTAPDTADPTQGLDNPFTQASTTGGKEDTGYTNPDGVEVEVDLEADIQVSGYRGTDAPAELGQFAVTYLRNRGEFYLESLAEHVSHRDRVEWRVDGNWLPGSQVGGLDASKLTHFRIKGVNAVLLHSASGGAQVGKVFKATVPLKPFTVMSDAGETCADKDDHIGLSQSVYWYQWNPEKADCKIPKQDMTVTISKTFQAAQVTYPEYDRLVADKKVTAVVLFGQIGDGAITDSDPGMYGFKRMGNWLVQGGFKEVAGPVGKRYAKHIGEVDVEVDLYSPNDFSGLGDYGHFNNFQKALGEHEIVVYDGHSMLGGSDFWARPQYPDNYQIYLYGGCLGYEYYVKHILDGKKGFENVDIMSSVVEVSANALMFAGPALAKLFQGLENGYKASWRDILVDVRRSVGDSTFGASGVRDNCFTPTGSRCGGADAGGDTPAVDANSSHYANATAVAIPDNAAAGVKSTIDVPDTFTVKSVNLELNVEHSYVGDLKIVLKKGRKSVTVWNNEGDGQKNIEASFDLGGFEGVSAKGTWTLQIVDAAAQDAGTLKSWALTLGR